MTVDRSLRNGQTQSGTLAAATDHWEENALFDLFGDTWTIVNNLQATDHLVMLASNGETALNSLAESNLRICLRGVQYRLHSVARYI